MKKIINEMVVTETPWGDDITLRNEDGEGVEVVTDTLYFANSREVDEFAQVVKDMLKEIS